MAFEFTIDTNTLGVLASVISVLRQNEDSVDSDTVWSLADTLESELAPAVHTQPLDLFVQNVKAATRQLEAVQSALNELTFSCKEKIENVRRLYPFSGYRIIELPDDILALIFQLSWDQDREIVEYPDLHFPSTSPCDTPVVSRVCRRFRDLSLRLPRLWVHIYSFMRQDWIDVLLQRSKNAGLIVSAYCWQEKGDSLVNFMTQLVPHAARWKTFTLMTEGRDEENARLMNTELGECCSEMYLPILGSFTVYNDVIGSDYMVDFYKIWKIPNLYHLTTTRHIDILPSSYDLHSLTSFEFVFDQYSDCHKVLGLWKFLGTLVNLTDLEFVFDGRYVHAFDGYINSISRAELPNVTRLTLKFRDRYLPQFMMDLLLMPALEHLFIRTSGWVHPPKRRKMIENGTSYGHHRHMRLELSEIFQHFPCLKRLTLHTPDLYPSFHNTVILPPLQSVRILGDTMCDASSLLLLRNLLDVQGKWKEFEFLEIHEAEFFKVDECLENGVPIQTHEPRNVTWFHAHELFPIAKLRLVEPPSAFEFKSEADSVYSYNQYSSYGSSIIKSHISYH